MHQTEPTAAESGRADLLAWEASTDRNYFDTDPLLQGVLRRLLGREYDATAERLHGLAARLGSPLSRLVTENNRDENLPTLRRHDQLGRPVEEVVHHPAHHQIGRVFWGSGVLAELSRPGNEVLTGAIAYLLDHHGEAGHACPVACTAGAIKLLQRVGSEDQRQRYLPGLLEPDYDRRLHAAQFVTEIQGGSDVGSNCCLARPVPDRPGWYGITGEKWFCSVADAGLFVVSARTEGAEEGTRGLGLFLVPRSIDGRINGFRLRRLKVKLGTRSMPTGEIEFDDALGELVGRPGDGFRNLVGIVLDTSRVHNALAACGIIRRAFVEGQSFAARRRAFGRAVAEFPAVQQTLARIRLRGMAALTTTFRILAMTDRLERGGPDPDLLAARRIAVMINKYWTATAATEAARDGIELLGGNGTIEDLSVLPRLYRDAIVVESWEGTHNTLCAQVLRDFADRGLHRPWLQLLAGEIEDLDCSATAGECGLARRLLQQVDLRIQRLLASDATTAAAHIRSVVDHMCRLTDWVALAGQHHWSVGHGAEGLQDALDLYRLVHLDRADPQDCPELAELAERLSRAD